MLNEGSNRFRGPQFPVSTEVSGEIVRFMRPAFDHAGWLAGDIDGKDRFDDDHIAPAVSLIRSLREQNVPRKAVREVIRRRVAVEFKRMPYHTRVMRAELVIGYLSKTGESTP